MDFIWNIGKQIVRPIFTSNANQFSIVEISPNAIQTGQYVCLRNEDTIYLLKEAKSVEIFNVCVQWPSKNSGKIYSHPIAPNNQWNIVHHISMLGFDKYFVYKSGDPRILTLVNTPAMPDGLFPLHIAVQNGHTNVVTRLIGLGADVATVDPNGMTSLHYAALKDEGTVMALSRSPKCRECANNENGRGYTPLYSAILEGKPDCFRALLAVGASPTVPCMGKSLLFHLVTSTQTNPKRQECLKILLEARPNSVTEPDLSTGDTVFHLVTNVQILTVLLRSSPPNVNLNVRNAVGNTPLLTQMSRNNLDCFIKLLSYGAGTEERDAQSCTPLHRAIEHGFLDFVKVLLIFAADTSATDKNGNSLLHLATHSSRATKREILRCLEIVETNRCPPGKQDCSTECVYRPETGPPAVAAKPLTLHEFAQTLAVSAATEKKRQGKKLENLLALDGGGIRGLILIQTLLCIEKRLNVDNILSKFHWVAGTSTGAIVATALCSGRTLRDVQKLYFRFKDDVFGSGSRPYDTATLENFLKNELGVQRTMSSVQNCKLVLTTVDGNVLPLKLQLIRNFQLPLPLSAAEQYRLGYEDPNAWPLWKAARCSSAAPTYFAAVDDKYIDGGVIANNPTLDLLGEVQNFNTALKMKNQEDSTIEIGCILSVGTGRMPDSSMNTLKLTQPSGILDTLAAAFAIKDLGKLLIEQVTESEGRPVDRSRAFCHALNVPFYRFSTRLQREVSLDETKNDALIEALWQTIEYMHSAKVSVEELVGLL